MEQNLVFTTMVDAAYIHIPFCRRRCYYCDFPVFVIGERLRGETSLGMQQYVATLTEEIANTLVSGQYLKTIFFGGGTPSLLSVDQLQQILAILDRRFGIDKEAEISMEMDPGTFDLPHISGYRHAGINRISLGVQAFQAELLQVCGRSHNLGDIFSAIEMIRQVGVPELSLDLISGLPHQTLEIWQDSLKQAVAITPTHVSIYDLTIEPGTAFGRYFQPGDRHLPTDEITVKMYRLAQHLLTGAGYEHYEISNYAQPRHQCHHNRVYWENRPYYGFGMAAASYMGGKRFTRPRKTQEYYQWVKDGGVINCEVTPVDEMLLDTLMLGLRLAEGVGMQMLIEKFGKQNVEKIFRILQPFVEKRWVQIVGGRLKLSDPEGFLFSNVVLSTLFKELGK